MQSILILGSTVVKQGQADRPSSEYPLEFSVRVTEWDAVRECSVGIVGCHLLSLDEILVLPVYRRKVKMP